MSLSESVDRLNQIEADDHRSVGEFRTVIDEICMEFADRPDATNPAVLRICRAARSALLGYAADCAVEAVRERSTDRVVNGLTALVIENGGFDLRDTIRALAKLFHSASMLKLDTIALFDQFAGMCANDELATSFRRFSVPPGAPSVSLREFGLRTAGAGANFRYLDRDNPLRAARMYLAAPNLTASQRGWFILRLVRDWWQNF